MSLRTVKKIKEMTKKEKEEEDDTVEIQEEKKPKQFFSMLDNSEEENEEEDLDAENNQNLKVDNPNEENNNSLNSKEKTKDSNNKKKKKKSKKNKVNQKKEDDDDLNIILRSKEIKLEEEEKKSNDLTEDQSKTFCLDIKLNLLNYNKELQRYFKNAKISEGVGQGDLTKKESKQMKMLKNRQYKAHKTYYLSYGYKPIGTIPEKFSCEKVGVDEFGNSIFAFMPSKKYMNLQETYEGLKNTHDPNNIFDFLNQNPFHIDCLYDVGDYFRLKGDFKQANALLEQILFLYEESFSYEFGALLNREAKNIVLSWDHNKFSKSLFLTIVKFIDILGKKACYKAALEYNKFLIKLNPLLDPVGGLLILDYNAISARNYEYLLNFVEKFCKEIYGTNKFSIMFLPNYIYSCALAKFSQFFLLAEKNKSISNLYQINSEDFGKAIVFGSDYSQDNHNVLLFLAVLIYPQIIIKIINENEIHKQNLQHSSFKGWQKKNYKEILEHPFFQEKNQPLYTFLQLQNEDDVEGLNKLLEIYIERSKIIWKGNHINMWIKSILGYILNEFEEKKLNYSELFERLCSQECCKKIPFELRRYKSLTKQTLIEQMQRLDLNNIPDLQGNQGPPQNYNPLNMQQGFLSLLMNSLLPWNHLPQNGPQQGQNLGQEFENNGDFDEDAFFE